MSKLLDLLSIFGLHLINASLLTRETSDFNLSIFSQKLLEIVV